MSAEQVTKFVLTYSNHVVEHLGVRLYQNKPEIAAGDCFALYGVEG